VIIVGLVSSFREGAMLRTAVASLDALDHVAVFEGPVEGNPDVGPASELPTDARKRRGQPTLLVREGAWETDAAKRTAMVEWTRQRWPGREVWGLWLDGDEILLWGEYLRDWLWRVRQGGDPDNPVAGWPFALVELDGSTSICMGKLVRVDLISRYLVSSSYIELVNGERRTVGNVLAWTPTGGPEPGWEGHWRARPPLQGEPHLQHRPILRDRSRVVERQHAAEERNYRAEVLDKA
jgi:hypothetical protein